MPLTANWTYSGLVNASGSSRPGFGSARAAAGSDVGTASAI